MKTITELIATTASSQKRRGSQLCGRFKHNVVFECWESQPSRYLIDSASKQWNEVQILGHYLMPAENPGKHFLVNAQWIRSSSSLTMEEAGSESQIIRFWWGSTYKNRHFESWLFPVMIFPLRGDVTTPVLVTRSIEGSLRQYNFKSPSLWIFLKLKSDSEIRFVYTELFKGIVLTLFTRIVVPKYEANDGFREQARRLIEVRQTITVRFKKRRTVGNPVDKVGRIFFESFIWVLKSSVSVT